MVIHDATGARIGCGVIAKSTTCDTHSPTASPTTTAPTVGAQSGCFSPYPGYSGSLHALGSFVVSTGAGGALTVDWTAAGLDPVCASAPPPGVGNACGIHIHSGTSCADASLVGGHYYAGLSSDPWSPIVYTAQADASSTGTVSVVSGYTLDDVVGRAMVIHDATGARIGCGTIGGTPSGSFSSYPGYSGALNVAGTFSVANGAGGALLLDWEVSGLDTACASTITGVGNACGIHVHSGTSCADAAL
eukprot:gene7068-biopygen35174